MVDHMGQLQLEEASKQGAKGGLNSPCLAVHFNLIYSDWIKPQ